MKPRISEKNGGSKVVYLIKYYSVIEILLIDIK